MKVHDFQVRLRAICTECTEDLSSVWLQFQRWVFYVITIFRKFSLPHKDSTGNKSTLCEFSTFPWSTLSISYAAELVHIFVTPISCWIQELHFCLFFIRFIFCVLAKYQPAQIFSLRNAHWLLMCWILKTETGLWAWLCPIRGTRGMFIHNSMETVHGRCYF